MFKKIALLALSAAAGVHALSDAPFRVKFELEKLDGGGSDSFTVRVEPSWAPIGAARFKELVEAGFYDNTRFFRVIPSFMAQFGLNGDGKTNTMWRAKQIKDDPVKESNQPGYITFAKTGAPNSRTTQLFINYSDNANLDGMGFAPFGQLEGNGMEVMRKVYNCGESPNQGMIQQQGNDYLDKNFKDLTQIKKVSIIEGDKSDL